VLIILVIQPVNPAVPATPARQRHRVHFTPPQDAQATITQGAQAQAASETQTLRHAHQSQPSPLTDDPFIGSRGNIISSDTQVLFYFILLIFSKIYYRITLI
jgi:hypothetical protein